MGMMQSYTYYGGFSQNMGNFYNIPQKSQPPKIFVWIDIHCEIQAVPFAQLSQMKPGEPSEKIRERVIKARNIQTERFSSISLKEGGGKGRIHCNAQMSERMLHEFAEPDAASLDMLRMAMEKLKLSARAYSRILKVARTIADLAGSEQVQSMHIAEAIGYRNLDRGDWAERGI
jgi:magnesium chelatase family protein